MLRVHQKIVLVLATVFIVALFSLASQVRGFSGVERAPLTVVTAGLRWQGKSDVTRLFSAATYVAVARRGDLYVADTLGARVLQLSPQGQVARTWTRAGRMKFVTPTGVAVDQHGNLYITDTTRRLVAVFSPRGRLRLVRQVHDRQGHVLLPAAITVDMKGNLYVVDQETGEIIEISPTGRVRAPWGTVSSGPDQLRNPHGIAADAKGNVYVADSGNLRIVKFSAGGKVVARFGHQRFESDEEPLGVAVDRQGTIYVGAGVVLKFSARGKLLMRWEKYGRSAMGTFGVAADIAGNIYAVQQHSGQVVKLSPAGRVLQTWG
jgi:DNA-binding beta-propeller fold protein YncE